MGDLPISDYRRWGVAYPIRVLEEREVSRYRAACDELEALFGGAPRTIDMRQMHLHFRFAYDLCTHPRVLDAVEQVLGPNLIVWATELFAKKPNDETLFIAWHRDRPYMGFEASLTTTAWISLATSTVENGCLQVLLEEDRAHSQVRGKQGPESHLVTNVVLSPGEMSLHDPDVFHGSLPNRSSEKRVGFAVRFVTPEARPLRGRPEAVLARGVDTQDHFDLQPPPREQSVESALHGMRRSSGLHFDAMLHNLKASR